MYGYIITFHLGANIFLADGGNCLKLGDFGCAAKIKSQTTMFGELQGFVGTQGKHHSNCG